MPIPSPFPTDPEAIAELLDAMREKGGTVVARERGYAMGSLYRWAGRHGLKPNRRRSQRGLREDAFSGELSAEARYWVGFLFADGCVGETKGRQPRVMLDLKASDRERIEAFARFLGVPQAVKDAHHGASVRIQVRSKALADDLARYGVAPRKSHTATPPDLLRLDRDFWRGVVDGDGCVFPRADTTMDLNLCGSRPTIEAFIAFAEHIGCKPGKSPSKASSIFQVHYYGEDATKLHEALYGDAETSMARKAVAATNVIG